MTLSEIKRLLEAQKKPRTVEGLCQMASALSLISIACDLETISSHVGDISEQTGSIAYKLEIMDRTLDGIDDRLTDISRELKNQRGE